MGMKQTPIHLLTKYGILTNFSMAKKITEEDINAMKKAEKSKGMKDEEVMEKVKNKLMQELIEAAQKGTLPGSIVDNTVPKTVIPIKNIESLNRLVVMLATKLKDKKYDKLSLCYFINFLVGSLGLGEEDFEEFHRQLRDLHGDDDEDDGAEA